MRAPAPTSPEWAFYVVTQVARAAVGLLSGDVLGFAVQIEADSVILHSAVTRLTDEVRDDLDHICFELDVLLDGHVAISHVESVGVDRPWPPVGWHPIYVAKIGSAASDQGPVEGS